MATRSRHKGAREFRKYLECGILAYGFARAKCTEGFHEFLIALSCKCRAVCPSVVRDAWWKPLRTGSIRSFLLFRYATGCCLSLNACGISSRTTHGWSASCCGYFLGIVKEELLKRCPDVPPTARACIGQFHASRWRCPERTHPCSLLRHRCAVLSRR
ncbi:MAG: hypothetical protein N838_33555 [Thiohalocapsa sp. PB-PSB1]|nr:MAG: hypothetical protein N838_33555 [Thiohalocapsa sp. PB-PSB1]